MTYLIGHLFALCTLVTSVNAEYECVCSYSVERRVYNGPGTSNNVIGYMYEFDCKKTVPGSNSNNMFAVEFEKQLGFVAQDNEIQSQICPGDPSTSDLIPPTTTTHSTTTELTKTSTSPTSSATSPAPTTSSTSSNSPTAATSPSTTVESPTVLPSSSSTTSTLSPTTSIKTASFSPTTTKVTPTSTIAPTITSMTSPTTKSTATTMVTASTTPTSRAPTTIRTTVPPLKLFDTTGSPLAYVGIGYNLLEGNPTGMDKSGVDSGLLVSRRIFQLTQDLSTSGGAPLEADITYKSTCDMGSSTFVVHDGLSYQRELLHFAHTTSSKGVQEVEAFTLNTEFNQVRQQTEGQSSNVYLDVTSSCLMGHALYRDSSANSSEFSISRDFASDVCKLPGRYNETQFMAFLDKWGTNIVMSTDFGTLTTARYRTTGQEALSLFLKQGRSTIMYPAKAYEGYPSSVAINSSQLASSHVPLIGSQLQRHQMGTKANPVPLDLILVPLTQALNAKYWRKVLRQEVFTDICSDVISESFLQQVEGSVEMALTGYPAHRKVELSMGGLLPMTDHPIMVPLTWPSGTYGLMMSSTGCPGSKVNWATGYRTYDTEDSSSNNYFSPAIQNYMAGSFDSNNIQTKFCMKTTASIDSRYERSWPSGTYCIMKRGNCPQGFGPGYIYWDDQDISNSNKAWGSLPDGSYSHNTKIYYCCRDDAPPSTPVLLPRDRPFVLVRYGSSCQSVLHMNEHGVFIRWDDEDIFNGDEVSGKHPFDDGGSKDHKLHFCHYREGLFGVVSPGIIG